MLGNLHVRFGVGAGVKFPGLHHKSFRRAKLPICRPFTTSCCKGWIEANYAYCPLFPCHRRLMPPAHLVPGP